MLLALLRCLLGLLCLLAAFLAALLRLLQRAGRCCLRDGGDGLRHLLRLLGLRLLELLQCFRFIARREGFQRFGHILLALGELLQCLCLIR